MSGHILSIDTLLSYAPMPEALCEQIRKSVDQKRKDLNRKIIVLDDDPTGTQTVHGVNVYTDWEEKTIRAGMQEKSNLFFILTNSRSFSSEKTRRVHGEIGRRIAKIAAECGRDYILVSRSDSTLRGHYPLETETLRDAVERNSDKRFDGEILFPFFVEGGRYTIDNVHYAQEGNQLIPVGMTEFARDRTFGYRSSDLTEWCEEKTGGRYTRDKITCITLKELRGGDTAGIARKLTKVKNFDKVIVNAIDYEDVTVFLDAYYDALKSEKEFLFRSAASLVKALEGITHQPLLDCKTALASRAGTGGIVIAGSHVRRTTLQLQYLRRSNLPLEFIQFDQHRVLERGGLRDEAKKASAKAEAVVNSGKIAVVYTRRDRLDLDTDDPEKQLAISTEISDALVRVIDNLNAPPHFIVAKGGITSSDIATKALHIWRAEVLGQIEPGVPVWMTGKESKFPGMAYIIFPGNVGEEDCLYRIVAKLLPGTNQALPDRTEG